METTRLFGKKSIKYTPRLIPPCKTLCTTQSVVHLCCTFTIYTQEKRISCLPRVEKLGEQSRNENHLVSVLNNQKQDRSTVAQMAERQTTTWRPHVRIYALDPMRCANNIILMFFCCWLAI